MITLDVKPYCCECEGFNAVTEKSKVRANDSTVYVNVTVKCEHARKCEAMYKHILKESSKNAE